jgi:hypothetical protein
MTFVSHQWIAPVNYMQHQQANPVELEPLRMVKVSVVPPCTWKQYEIRRKHLSWTSAPDIGVHSGNSDLTCASRDESEYRHLCRC